MHRRTITLSEVAVGLDIDGVDRERTVRRLLLRHQVPYIRVNRNKILLTKQQFDLLLRRMTCLASGNGADTTTVVERSVSA